jgi:hypothetical protein
MGIGLALRKVNYEAHEVTRRKTTEPKAARILQKIDNRHTPLVLSKNLASEWLG